MCFNFLYSFPFCSCHRKCFIRLERERCACVAPVSFYTQCYHFWCSLMLFTSAEREVKDSRRSVDFFWQDWARKVCRFSVLFGYLTKWKPNYFSSRYLEISSISLIYSLTYSRKKELLFWLARGLNRLTCATLQIRGDSKLRD